MPAPRSAPSCAGDACLEFGFLCVEPLLEPVRLDLRGIAWVIVGGESGPRARHMPAELARDVRDRATGVPIFMKQMSRREPLFLTT